MEVPLAEGLSAQRAIAARVSEVRNHVRELRGLLAGKSTLLDRLEPAGLERAFRGEL